MAEFKRAGASIFALAWVLGLSGAASASQTANVTITAAGTLGTINVLTQGAANKDFQYVSGGTCTTGTFYAVNSVCSVLYTFTPTRPGLRMGAVSLTGTGASPVVLGTAYIHGTGTGALATFPGISTPARSVGGGFSAPTSLAVDGSGDVFVADTGNHALKEIVAVNGEVTPSSTVITLGSGYGKITGVAVDGSGNLFVVDNRKAVGVNEVSGALYEFAAVNGVVTSSSTVNTVGSGFPYGVAVDGNGNIFITDTADWSVKEIVATNGVVTYNSTVNTFNGFGDPQGSVAVDASGDIFLPIYGDGGIAAIIEFVAVDGVIPSDAAPITVGSGLNIPEGVAVDASGNVFATSNDHYIGNYQYAYSNSVFEIVAVDGVVNSSSTVNAVSSSFNDCPVSEAQDGKGPSGIALDGNGNLFVADSCDDQVYEIDLTAPPAQAFASTAVGSTSSDSPRSLTIQNAGNAPLTFSSLATGTDNFPVSGTGTCSTSTPLAQSGVCTIAASFTPEEAGSLADTFTLTDNSFLSSFQTVALSGSAPGGFTATLATPLFSPAATEPEYTSQSITISEEVTYYYQPQPTGAVTFSMNGVSYTATCTPIVSYDFELCSAQVPAATIAALNIGFYTVTPALAADSNYGAESGPSITFTITAPSEPVGTASAPQTAYVTITTAGTLGTINVLTQGAAYKDFQYVSGGTCTTGASYAVNAVCSVFYTFTPSRPGPRLGAVSLTSTGGSPVVLGTSLLYGTGTGALATFPGSTAVSRVGSGFNIPFGAAVDGNGDVFVADPGNNAVKEIVAVSGVVTSGSTINTAGSSFSGAYGVAVDGSGDVFVADNAKSVVYEIVAVNGVVTSASTVNIVGSGFNGPTGVAVDASGNVFVADFGNSAVKEIVAVNGVVTSASAVNMVGDGFSVPFGVAVDASGDVFVADFFNNAVKEIVASDGVVQYDEPVNTVGSGFNGPTGVAVDASGNVFVADFGNSAVKEIVAVNGVVTSGSTVNTIGSGFNGPTGVAVDGSGHVFVADYGNSAVKKIDLTAAPAQAFAPTAVGSTSSDSPRKVTVQNAGNAALTFSSLATGTANFTVSGTGTCSTSTSLAQSGVCTVAASFTPHQGGSLTDTLTLTDSSFNGSTQTVGLSGTATK